MLKPAIFLLLVSSSLAAQRQTTFAKSSIAELPDAPSFLALNLLRLKSAVPTMTMATNFPISSRELEQLEGVRVRLALLTPVSSKQPSGSSFQARLERPVMLNGKTVIPQEAIFEGHIESTHSRRMMRRGALYLAFDQVVLPSGERYPIHAYLASAGSNQIRKDSEGQLRPTWSRKRIALELGGTALIGKLADDIAESAAAGTVGATSARYIGLGTSALFLAVQKGPDAQLTPGTQIQVEFGRAPAIPSSVEHID